MRAYSLDLRERVVRAVDQGYPRREIVKLLGVSSATIKRYLKRRRETGHLHPRSIPGRPPQISAPLRDQLVAQLEAAPDATLEMHCHGFEHTTGVLVSASTMSRAIRHLGWTRKKKTIGASERDEEERAAWCEQRKGLDATRLVVLDECGSHIGLTPVYARAPRGMRAFGQVPRNRGKNTTFRLYDQHGATRSLGRHAYEPFRERLHHSPDNWPNSEAAKSAAPRRFPSCSTSERRINR